MKQRDIVNQVISAEWWSKITASTVNVGRSQGNEIKTNDSGVKEDDDGDHERINDDSDEEYVPLPGSSAASTTEQSRSDQTANRKKVDSKKDSVQCHVCDKSFKSKYYLKVHNR